MENWVLLKKGGDFEAHSQMFHITKRLASLIRNREVIGEESIRTYLYGTIAELHDGMLMKDMDRAIELLMEKIKEGASIRIIGDYDIDGVNASYILVEGLKRLGGVVDVDIPDRIMDGYGLNKNLIDRAFEDGIDTIVTCDNGIAATEEIAYGKELGMTIIVTDHHEVPFEELEQGKTQILPMADAVVDPKRLDCQYPFDGLCGAAVAYKVVEALFEAMGEEVEEVDYLMEHVALATVGDVMDLVGENRIFVKQGIEMLRRTKNHGLKALMECTGVVPDKLSTYHIGFVLGPCLNAGGRLDTAKRALNLLCAETKKEADILAGDLKALNDSRKEMTAKAVEQAKEQIENTDVVNDRVLVLYLPDCHESLAGIVAGRIRECYYKPTIILTDAEDQVKGSARSVEAYHMYEELNKCKHLLMRFGGHKLAAGLSMKQEDVAAFRKEINDQCMLQDVDLIEKVAIDMELPFSAITEAFVEELALLEPFGKGNKKPVFAERQVKILSGKIIGKQQNILKFKVQDKYGTTLDAIYFGEKDKMLSYIEEQYTEQAVQAMLQGQTNNISLSITFYPEMNEYMGNKTAQVIITHYK